MKPASKNPAPNGKGLIVVTGPSGVGKTTIVRKVVSRTGIAYSVSVTTRPPRPGEREGADYFFIGRPGFQAMVKHRRLLEHAEIFGEHYGTPLEPVRAALQAGRPIILEIDVQGGIQVHRKMPQATFILILPPSDEELRRRLSGRGTESPKAVQARFDKARAEIRAARRSGAYHRVVINDNLREVVRQVVQIIKQECDKP